MSETTPANSFGNGEISRIKADHAKAISAVKESNLQLFNKAAEQAMERVPWPWNAEHYEARLRELRSAYQADAQASLKLNLGDVEQKAQRTALIMLGAEMLTRISQYVERARQKQRLANLEPRVSAPSVAAETSPPLENKRRVDDFLRRCEVETGQEIQRQHIWLYSGYKDDTEFSKWQSGKGKSKGKPNKTAAQRFEAILKMQPREFVEDLCRRKKL